MTNSFEYFGRTRSFDQDSHTLMLEIRARPSPHLLFFADAEQWLRYARSLRGRGSCLDFSED